MNAHRLWPVAAASLALALAAGAAEKDAFGDLMPDGATARMGTPRMRVATYAPPALSADAKYIFVQSTAGLLQIDPISGAAAGKPKIQVYGGQLVPASGGKNIAVAGANGATVADLATGKALARVERRLPGADAAALSADGRLLALGAAGDGIKREPLAVLLWDVNGDREIKRLGVPQNDDVRVALSGTGGTLAAWGLFRAPEAKGLADPSADMSRVVTVFDVASGKEQARFRSAGSPPATVCLSPDGALAAVAPGNGTIELIDAKTGALKSLLLGRSRSGRALSFSPDGSTLAAAAEDGAVQRWKVADGSRLSTTEPPVGAPTNTQVRAVSAEQAVAWGMRGSAVAVWAVPSGKLLSTDGGHVGAVRGLAVTPDGKQVLTSAEDGATLRWELATGKPMGAVPLRLPDVGFGAQPGPAALSADARFALVRDSTGGVGVHDLATGAQQYVIPAALDGYSQGFFSPDGGRIVVTTSAFDPKKGPCRVAVYEAASGKRLGGVELPGYRSVVAAVTRDGKFVVTAGFKPGAGDRAAFVVGGWDVASGARSGEWSEEAGVNAPHVAPATDNVSAAVVTSRGRVVAFGIRTGRVGEPLKLDRVPGSMPVFAPDGKRIAIAGPTDYLPAPSSQLVVLDWPSGAVRHTFRAPGGVPGVMAFSPDGKALVTGLPDTTAIVWDVSK